MKLKHLILPVMTFFMISCNQSEEFEYLESRASDSLNNQIEVEPTKEEIKILLSHITEKNNFYSLTISQEKAEELGISKELYTQFSKELFEASTLLQEYKLLGHEIVKFDKNNIIMTDEENISPLSNLGPTINSSPTGHIETQGQEFGYDCCDIKIKFAGINFHCFTRAALVPVYTCRTNALGAWTTKSTWGTKWTVTNISVTTAASLVPVGVAFATSDSNGGICNWDAYGLE